MAAIADGGVMLLKWSEDEAMGVAWRMCSTSAGASAAGSGGTPWANLMEFK